MHQVIVASQEQEAKEVPMGNKVPQVQPVFPVLRDHEDSEVRRENEVHQVLLGVSSTCNT